MTMSCIWINVEKPIVRRTNRMDEMQVVPNSGVCLLVADDGPEIQAYGTDPARADSDGDGLGDGEEVLLTSLTSLTGLGMVSGIDNVRVLVTGVVP
jgi:hypothetical protein